jgi:uncharacterized protein YggT (Ycf19 family)
MIRFLITIYIYILVFDAIFSFFPEIRKYSWATFIKKMADFTCKPTRRYLPANIGFDISHFVVIVALKIITVLW